MRVEVFPASVAGWVEFSCSLGVGIGIWNGDGDPVRGEIDVEFEVSLPVCWSSIGVLKGVGDDRIEISAVDNKLVNVFGRVLDCDEQGVLSLAVGPTHLLLDTRGEPILGVVGRRVRVSDVALEVFPYEL